MRIQPRYVVVLLFLCSTSQLTLLAQTMQGPTTIRTNVHHDVSPPLSVMAQNPPSQKPVRREAEDWKRIPLPPGFSSLTQDPVVQPNVPTVASPSAGLNFEGLGQGQYGFAVNYAPPDTNGAVGATQYVQWVNVSFIVFDKATGAKLLGPVAGNTLWSGFGGGCQTNNNGDPIVQYDKLADRWVMSQFSVGTTPYLQCIAVSMTNDATGQWYRYSFQYTNFDDYPKMGVWPDAYYETFDMFQGGVTYVGPDACAYDRNKMLLGQPATQVCFQQTTALGPLVPADLDGTNPPPTGSPNYMLTYGTNTLGLYKFHVDFVTPTNSTFTGPTVIPVAAFSPLCGGGTCVPQPSTTQKLDSLADRLMYRVGYRNFGSHESLVVSHSVVAGSSGGVRWYEIQNPSGTPVVAQQSTYAPDSTYRWMPSIAMDQAGNLAVGYSKSSSSLSPSVAYAGRLATDPVNTLQTETVVVNGAGSQTGNNLSRWGDYSAMTVDPVDDCTFWYTQEYMKTTGSFNWNTRIANFKFPNCGSSVSLIPSSLTFAGQLVGTTSSPQSITMTNNGSSSVTGITVATSGDYAQTNTCGTTLGAGLSCTISVTFTPTGVGTRTGTLTVTDSVGTQTASLTGTGTSGVTLTPSTVNFGSQGVGTTGSPVPLTLSNPGSTSLTGISIGFTGVNAGDFAESDNCGTTLAANSSCIINVTFAPNGYGARTATLAVNGSGGTQTSSLSGTGTDITPPTTQITAPANGATVSATVTVTATASDNVGITSIQIYVDGALAKSGTTSPLTYSWDTTLLTNGSHTIYSTASDAAGNAGNSTTITVTVNNAVQQLLQNTGFETGTLTFWNAGGVAVPFATSAKHNTGTYSAQLGSSVTPEPNGDSWLYQTVSIPSTATAASLNFYYWPVCNDTLANDWQEAQIQNASGTMLAQVMKVCSNTQAWTKVYFNLLPYKGQTLRVYFNAHGNGNNLLTYMYVDDVTVSIKGGGGSVALTPASVNFSSQNIGTTSAPQTFTLSNPQTTALTGISIGFTGTNAGDFAESDNCGTTIAANASCTINVTFTPAAAGSRTATLNVNDSVGMQTASLTGTGTSGVTLTPASLGFGSQIVGTTSTSQPLTLNNAGGTALTGISIGFTGANAGDFAESDNCGTTIAANSSCTINVTFTPAAVGSRTATLNVNDSAGTQTSSLTGSGTSGVTLTPASLGFGSQAMGTTSSPQPLTLNNAGGTALTGISIGFTGANAGDFAESDNCGTTIAASSSCTINVTFTPAAAGSRTATLNVNDSAGTQSSSLSGTGADTTPPTTQITTPANGATVSGVVTVTAAASDNVGVTSMQIFVDGAQVATGASSPLNYSWNTSAVTNGTHTIFSKASDAAGNVGTSTTITVTVNNSVQQLFQNTGFETGDLSSWTAGGVYTPFVTSVRKYAGNFSAQMGASVAPEPNGDSWVYQSAAIPSTAVGASLNFDYWGSCADANDYQEVQIQNASGVMLAQVMKLCDNSQTWKKVYFNLLPYKGQTVRVYFNVHGNGNNNLTFMNLDEVTFSVK